MKVSFFSVLRVMVMPLFMQAELSSKRNSNGERRFGLIPVVWLPSHLLFPMTLNLSGGSKTPCLGAKDFSWLV